MPSMNPDNKIAAYIEVMSTIISPADIISMHAYIKTMDHTDRLVFEIGIEQLGSSFSIIKSSGYLKWKATQD
jgi:hypothetical protein